MTTAREVREIFYPNEFKLAKNPLVLIVDQPLPKEEQSSIGSTR